MTSIEGLSSHAGQEFLLRYACATQGRLKRIILIHGEETPASIFKQKLAEVGFDHMDYQALGDEY